MRSTPNLFVAHTPLRNGREHLGVLAFSEAERAPRRVEVVCAHRLVGLESALAHRCEGHRVTGESVDKGRVVHTLAAAEERTERAVVDVRSHAPEAERAAKLVPVQ